MTTTAVRWFGEFNERAVLSGEQGLAAAIADFSRGYHELQWFPAKGGTWIRYILVIAPHHRRLFSVVLEPATDGTTITARIPVGRDPARRTLHSAGWPNESTSTGTRYYTRIFPGGPPQVAAKIMQAYRLVYADLANELSWLVTIQPQYATVKGMMDPTSGGPMIGRIRAKPFTTAFGVAVGLVCAWAALQSYGSKSGWTIAPLPTLLVLVGCVLLSTAVAMSGLPGAVVRRGAYMWGDSMLPRSVITFAFAGFPAIVWATALIMLLGTPPVTR